MALIGFAGAPWTWPPTWSRAAARRISRRARLGPASRGLFGALIDLLTEASIDYLDAQVEAGAEVLQLFDSWAGVLPPPRDCGAGASSPTRQIVGELRRRHPDVPVIGFPRGIGASYLPMPRRGSRTGLGLDTARAGGLGVAAAAAATLCLQGNLDPLALLGDRGGVAGRGRKGSCEPMATGRLSSISATACPRRRPPDAGRGARWLLEIHRRMSH